MSEGINVDSCIPADGVEEIPGMSVKFIEFLTRDELMSRVGTEAPVASTMFVLCDKGEITIRINFKTLTLRKGQFCLIIFKKDVRFMECAPDLRARFVLVSDEAMEYRRQVYRVDAASISLLSYLHECPAVTLNKAEYSVIDQYFNLLRIKASEEKRQCYKMITISLLQALFLDTFQIYRRNYEDSGSEKMNATRNEAVFIEFMGLVHKYHRKARNVGFYAGKLYITPKYLSSIVKQVSGHSAKELIDDYVISESKILLAKPRMNVQQVAFEFNFASQTFFGKYFKRHTGISPGDYKNSIE